MKYPKVYSVTIKFRDDSSWEQHNPVITECRDGFYSFGTYNNAEKTDYTLHRFPIDYIKEIIEKAQI